MSAAPGSVLLVGAGQMGGALLRGWLDHGLRPDDLVVLDPRPPVEIRQMAAARGFALNPDHSSVEAPDVFVLAVKPQTLDAVAVDFADLRLGASTLVSILAGKTVADLSARFRTAAIVRAMPNTPAAVGRGITGAFAGPGVDAERKARVDALLNCVGMTEWLDRETMIDAVTAVSGSGPAYVFSLVECLADAARAVGLENAQADRLARATVEGAGALMIARPAVPAGDLRHSVTSPGGTTAAALAVLDRDAAFATLMAQAVTAARDRAVELAG